MTPAPGALDGIRIIDLSTVILGPWATQMLADLGAEVIKIEPPEGDKTRQMGARRNDGMASMFLMANRNKRSVVLDLKTPPGRAALDRLIATADVVVHNLRPRVAAKLGLEPDTYVTRHPGLIFVSTFGFASGGPMANNPAYDDIIQAASGLASVQQITSDQPRYVPSIVADKTSSLYLSQAVLAALLHRERTGQGQAVEVPMFEALVDFLMVEHANGASFDPPIDQMGYARLMNTMRKPYATQDGYLAILPYTDRNWADFFRLSGRDDLIGDPRFVDLTTRVKHSQEIYGLLADIVATKTSAEWETLLDGSNIPMQRVNTLDDLLTDPQLQATGFWQMMDHPTEGPLRQTAPPIRYGASPARIRHLAQTLGQDTRAVLAEAGFTDTEITTMAQAGAIPAGDI